MGLMILAVFLGAAAAAGSLMLGASLWLAMGLYAIVGAAFILIAALAIFLASSNAPQTDSQDSTTVHS